MHIQGRPVAPLSIIAAELAALCEAMQADAATMPVLLARARRLAHLAGGLEPYVGACTTPPSAALTALIERTWGEPWGERFEAGETAVALEAEMLSGHVEGQFLRMLVRATGARRILEIGLFTGYSAAAMAEALPADGYLLALEIDAFAANFARAGFAPGLSEKIHIEVGPAAAGLQRLALDQEVFDFVFIDADKAGYISYVQTILDAGLLRSGGLICVDNTLMQGEPYLPGEMSVNGRAIAAFNDWVAQCRLVEQVILPLRDGITLIQRV